MKLIIQIPCFNEAETLPPTLADLPKACAVVLDGPAPASIDEVTYGLGGGAGGTLPAIAEAAPAVAGPPAPFPRCGCWPCARPAATCCGAGCSSPSAMAR